MKKQTFIFPLIGLLVVGCSGTTSETPSDQPQDGTSTTQPVTSTPVDGEFDVTAFNALFGRDVYSLIPNIVTSDYQLEDDSSEDYPIDVYVTISDWTAVEISTYEEQLEATLDGTIDEGFQVEDNLFLQSFLESDVYIINLFSFPEIGDPTPKAEIDPTNLNALFGYDIYADLPKIYSEDYEVGDFSSPDYPIDVYIDLFDWEEADAYAYDDALALVLTLDDENGYVISENLYIFVGLDDQSYEVPVFYINIYSIADEDNTSQPSEPVETGDRAEIEASEVNAFFSSDIYSQIPQIFSNDYLVGDYGDVEYPIDVYIDLFDWVEADAIAYETQLAALFTLDNDWGYILSEDLFIDIYFDDQAYAPETCWSINIFSVAS